MPAPTPAPEPAPDPAPPAAAGARPRRRPAWPELVSLVARLVLGATFAVSGALKLVDPAESVRAVRAYRLLPEALAVPVGQGLPLLEITLAALLLLGYGTRLAAAAAGVLLVLFIGGVTSAWARGLAIDCGCFGGGGDIAPKDTRYLQEILRDVGLLLAAGWLVVHPGRHVSLDRLLHPALHTPASTPSDTRQGARS